MVTHKNFTKIPITEEVIQWVSAISTTECQPYALTFVDLNGNNANPNIMYHNNNNAWVDGEETETQYPETQYPHHIFNQELQEQEQPQEQ